MLLRASALAADAELDLVVLSGRFYKQCDVSEDIICHFYLFYFLLKLLYFFSG